MINLKMIKKNYAPTLTAKWFSDHHMRITNGVKDLDVWRDRYWKRQEDKRGNINDYKNVYELIEKYFDI